MVTKKNFLSLVLIFFSICYVNAQETVTKKDNQQKQNHNQRIIWEKAENVFEYKVIIRSKDKSINNEYKTTENFVEFSLPLGTYEYKIITIDYLGRESGQTKFRKFKIIKNNATLEIKGELSDVNIIKVKKPQELNLLFGSAMNIVNFSKELGLDTGNKNFYDVECAIIYFPTLRQKFNYGIEMNSFYTQRTIKNTSHGNIVYRDFSTNLNFVFKHNVKENIAYSLKIGNGFSVLDYIRKATEDQNIYNNNLYYNLNFASSLLFTIKKQIIVELGAEFQNIFVPEDSLENVRVFVRFGGKLN